MRGALTALLVASVLWMTQATAATTIRVANWLPTSHPLVKDVLKPWGEAVEKATDGSVRVQVMSSPLGPPPAQYDLVAQGMADVGFAAHSYTPGRFAFFELVELPLQTPSAEVMSVAYWRTYDKLLADKNLHPNVKLLGLFTHGPGQIWNAQRPVTALNDLSGLKLRVPGGVAAEFSQRLGVVPVNAPSSQSYELLSSGVADGIVFPDESVTFFKLQKLLKHGTAVPGGFYNVSFYIVMNEKKWNSLTPQQQQAIDKVSGEYLARLAGKAWDAADEQGRKDIKAAGIEIRELTSQARESLEKHAAEIKAKVLTSVSSKGIDGQAFLAELERQIGTLSSGAK